MSLTARPSHAGLAVAIAMLAAVAGRAAAARPNDAEADAYTAALTRAIAAKERALDVNEPPRWEEALRLFQEAAALRSTRECAYEIGVAAEHLSRSDLAVESYEAAIDLGLLGPARARAQAFVTVHAAGMARLTVRGRAGRLVNIAGIRRGRLPLARPLVLFPGEVRLDIVDPTSTTGSIASVTIRVRGGQAETLDLDRMPQATKPPGGEAGAPPPVVAAPPVEPPAGETAASPAVPLPPAPQAQPSDAGPSPPEAGVSSRGLWIAGAGAVVTVAAVILLPVTSARLESDRSALMKECATPVVNDQCIAMTDHGPAAQSLADSIASWKAIRIGAMVGIGVGVATVATGLILRYHDGADAAAVARPALVFDHKGGRPRLGLAWTLRF
jgi:hypothetical protein